MFSQELQKPLLLKSSQQAPDVEKPYDEDRYDTKIEVKSDSGSQREGLDHKHNHQDNFRREVKSLPDLKDLKGQNENNLGSQEDSAAYPTHPALSELYANDDYKLEIKPDSIDYKQQLIDTEALPGNRIEDDEQPLVDTEALRVYRIEDYEQRLVDVKALRAYLRRKSLCNPYASNLPYFCFSLLSLAGLGMSTEYMISNDDVSVPSMLINITLVWMSVTPVLVKYNLRQSIMANDGRELDDLSFVVPNDSAFNELCERLALDFPDRTTVRAVFDQLYRLEQNIKQSIKRFEVINPELLSLFPSPHPVPRLILGYVGLFADRLPRQIMPSLQGEEEERSTLITRNS
jgi:hypothetical protein